MSVPGFSVRKWIVSSGGVHNFGFLLFYLYPFLLFLDSDILKIVISKREGGEERGTEIVSPPHPVFHSPNSHHIQIKLFRLNTGCGEYSPGLCHGGQELSYLSRHCFLSSTPSGKLESGICAEIQTHTALQCSSMAAS